MGAIGTPSADDIAIDRTPKRVKLTNGIAKTQHTPGASRVFAPYRTVGLVSSTSVPFVSVALGKTTFQITTSVGRSLQTYDLRRGLNLVFITRPQTPQAITASAAWKEYIFAAWGGLGSSAERGVWAFKRGKQQAALELPRGWAENVKAFCVFGSWLVGVCDTQLLVWKTTTLELYTTLQGTSPTLFTGCVSGLPTFLNKIIVGREDGSAEIWNVSSGRLVYTILPPSTASGTITAIEPTPALSLVAIAYGNGTLLIHDIRADETVIGFSSSVCAPVNSISFRTDGLGAGDDGRKAGVMATASKASGDITLWDLNEGGRRTGILRAAHSHPTSKTPGGVNRVEFLYGQAVMVSSGLDNCLRTWIFDHTPFSPIPRQLHTRSGHGATITKLHFLPSGSDGADDVGKWLVSASEDRSLWGWSLRRDGQSTELSQGAIQKKAKKQGLLSQGGQDAFENLKCAPITSIACSLNRDGGIGAIPGKHAVWQNTRGKNVTAEMSSSTGWESMVTAHRNSSKALTWFWGRKRAGRWAFETSDAGSVSSVAVSPCGTFAVIGSSKGAIDLYNLQSGMHRQRYPARLTPMQVKQLRLDVVKLGLIEEEDKKQRKFFRGQGRHGCAVVGLAFDALNKTIVSAGADGKVKFWDFSTGLLQYQIDWGLATGIVAMRFRRASELAAFSCSDGCIRVIDISTRRLVRELRMSRQPLTWLKNTTFTDFSISNDGIWVAACVGPIALLWDLPSGHLIDAFKLQADCTSIAFSPTGEFLATATTESVGVDVWTNKNLFAHVSTRHIGVEDLAKIVHGSSQAPTVSGEIGDHLGSGGDHEDLNDDQNIALAGEPDVASQIKDISSDMLSLSLVPRSRWQNLLHLDLIRQRNKPVEPPKKPEKAPFFLPSLDSIANKLNGNTQLALPDAAESEAEKSRFMKLDLSSSRSALSAALREAGRSQDFEPFVTLLKGMSPSSADIEIRSLSLEDNEMTSFVQALTWLMRERSDFELGQTWMVVFLRLHGDAVVGDAAVREAVAEWSRALESERQRVLRVAGYCGGVVGWLRAAKV